MTKYEECVCNPAYYTLSATDSEYDYYEQCGDKYHQKTCKAAFKYVNSTDLSTYGDSAMFLAPFKSAESCAKVLGTDTCVDTLGSVSITKAKDCNCDTSTYKYTGVSDATAFKLSDVCTDSDGTTRHYSTVSCSGTVTGSGTWKSSCATDTETYSSTEDKKDTASNVTCHLCKTKTCESEYTNPKEYGGETACKNNSGYNATTQKCVTSGHTVNNTTCYKVADKTCADYSGYYASESTCKSGIGDGYKCVNETTTANVGGLTDCYKRVAKTCSDYGYSADSQNYANSCFGNYKADSKDCLLGDTQKTCYKCIHKTCTDYGYSGGHLEESTRCVSSSNSLNYTTVYPDDNKPAFACCCTQPDKCGYSTTRNCSPVTVTFSGGNYTNKGVTCSNGQSASYAAGEVYTCNQSSGDITIYVVCSGTGGCPINIVGGNYSASSGSGASTMINDACGSYTVYQK